MRHDPANMHANITESLGDAGTGISADFTDFTQTVLQDLGAGLVYVVLPCPPPDKHYHSALGLSSVLVRPTRGGEITKPRLDATWESTV